MHLLRETLENAGAVCAGVLVTYDICASSRVRELTIFALPMEWIVVLSLLLLGLSLVVIEVIFVPGTTIVGVAGFVFIVVGVGLSFRYFGNSAGWLTAGGSTIAAGLSLFFSFKAGVWERFSLKNTMDGNVNQGEVDNLKAGTEGIALSALRPFGKAELQDKTYEVKTMGNYLDAGTRIRVTQILSHQIIVEPLT
jgi:membrane-bound ClpP family serine protease